MTETNEAGSASPEGMDPTPGRSPAEGASFGQSHGSPILTLAVSADRDAALEEVATALLDLAGRLFVNAKADVDGTTMVASPGDSVEAVVDRHEREAQGRRRFRA